MSEGSAESVPATEREYLEGLRREDKFVLRKGFTGAKPEGVCFWIFNLMGLTRDDELVDIFHGSGMVTDAWAAWRDMNVLDFTAGGHVA